MKPTKPTSILAIDSATGPCSVAVWDGNRIAAYVENLKPIMQSASLIPMVEEALRQSGKDYKDMGCIAAAIGPGSFTGIRVALASAQGIAYAAGIPTRGFTTLEVLAFAALPSFPPACGGTKGGDSAIYNLNSPPSNSPRKQGENHILTILQAGKGEWYYQYFAPSLEPLTAPKVAAMEQVIQDAPGFPITVSGNAVITEKGFTNCEITFPRADALAELAATASGTQELRPFYIRAPDAKLPASGNR